MRIRTVTVTGLIFGFALLFSTASPAFAQDPMPIGVKVGLNISSLSFDPEAGFEDFGSKPGLVVGVFLSRPLRAQLDLQVEALYSQKGGREEFSDDGSDFTATLKVDYIEIPVLANFTAASSDRMSFHVLAGPAFSFLVNDELKAEIDGEDIPVPDEDQPDVKKFDVGLAIGAAVRTGQLVFDVRYTWGLVDINDSADGDEFEPSVKNRAFTFSVGWLFGR